MTILLIWWILTLLGLSISDRAMATMIMEKKLSRLTPIDCEKYVYHPQCRGLQAKRRLSIEKKNNMLDRDGNDKIVKDDEKANICVCNYKTTNWTPSIKKKLEMFGHLKRNKNLKERNDKNMKEKLLLEDKIRKAVLNNNDVKKVLDKSKKLMTLWKQKKTIDDDLNSSYVAYIFVYT